MYTYDKGDRVTSLKVYQGSVLEMDLAYEYDAAGQLTAVVSDGVRTTYTYDAAGRLIEETNGLTGLKTQYFFTPAGQLAAEFVLGAEGAVKCYAYEYDRNGNQTLKAEGTEETRYYYDAIGRLETAELPDGRTQHFTYDARGNRTEMAEILDGYIQVTTYAYDLNNRLLYSENDTEVCRYEYDAQGNQTRRIIQNTAFGSVAETEFFWNGDNMLAYSIDPDGLRSSYGYGPDGLRVRKTVGDATTRFFYEGGNILMELDGSHRITAKTTRGIRLISRETLTTEYGYLLDGHGDVAALVSPAGELVLDYAYDPFGSEAGYQPDNADQWGNPFRYCGEYWDEETETYYLRARQYDPETGRFLSEDTHWNPGNMLYGDHPRQLSRSIYTPNMLAIKQGSNAYVYCVNDPLKYMDVSGNAVILAFLTTYGYLIVSSPDFQLDLDMLAFDLSQGDYVSAGFDVLDILAPGISGSKSIPKVVNGLDDASDTARAIGKGVKEVLSEIPSSRILRNNMVEEGITAPKYAHAAHHIVAGNSKYAKEARAVLKKFEVGINHYANGVFLPTVKGVSDAAYHPSLHTKDYYKKVNDLLSDADSQEDVISILTTIAEQLSNGTF